ncbi:hypothetical protein VNO77_22478 [Canavalia gladiata]|uniref:Uncharacterized protein n=1 Tax=Canavalia gladiata TaxID=3824 RepID=A0AAN9L7W3_CANGL
MALNVLKLFHQVVGLNTTSNVCKHSLGSEPEILGSRIKKAILLWAVSSLGMDMDELKRTHKVFHVETFNSEKKQSSGAIRKEINNKVFLWGLMVFFFVFLQVGNGRKLHCESISTRVNLRSSGSVTVVSVGSLVWGCLRICS